MIYLAFLGGVIAGLIITRLIFRRISGFGYFYLEPYDDDNTGFYKINMAIKPNQNLLKKDYIILEKDHSQK